MRSLIVAKLPILYLIQVQLTAAQQSLRPVNAHVSLFVHLLKSAYDEACSRYIDLFLEREGPNAADRLSERSLLVFLLDEEAPLPQLHRERSLSEMVADKLRRRQSVESVSSELSSPQSPGLFTLVMLPAQQHN